MEGLGCYTAVVDSLECAEAVITELQRQAPVAHAREMPFCPVTISLFALTFECFHLFAC